MIATSNGRPYLKRFARNRQRSYAVDPNFHAKKYLTSRMIPGRSQGHRSKDAWLLAEQRITVSLPDNLEADPGRLCQREQDLSQRCSHPGHPSFPAWPLPCSSCGRPNTESIHASLKRFVHLDKMASGLLTKAAPLSLRFVD